MNNRISAYFSDSSLGRPTQELLQAIELFDGEKGERTQYTVIQLRRAIDCLLRECAHFAPPYVQELQIMLERAVYSPGWATEDLEALHCAAQLRVPPAGYVPPPRK